ncbi:DUF4232 domain-containing protein [Jatrophihabitans telluris]|uniref:DUF4232 domain-containing protein n=1 Tax=Jatrophihabitans telluris TaxID=2038343 RepID=A0ABY4QWS0_9ACTN|nr:DUF4232 domain-containing protein [Jatrophihabitans telluris]UQX87908.1 DUF4232 domain-containing protein [Jatrophihabitans telluris]
MTERTLTEELDSVLRAHALDAPDPAATISAVLAATVAVPGDPQDPRWWRPLVSARAAGWVAAVLVVIGGGVGAVVAHPNGQTKSSSAGSAAADRQNAGGYAANRPNADSQASAAAGAAGGTAALLGPRPGVTSPGIPTGAGADCGAGQSGTAKTFPARVPDPATGDTLYFATSACSGTAGTSEASTVTVYRLHRRDALPEAVLLTPREGLHTTDVTVSSERGTVVVTVTGTDYRAVTGPRHGALTEYRFAMSTDGRTFTPLGNVVTVQACVSSQLRANATLHPEAGWAAAVKLTNTGPQSCVLQGYPDVSATAATDSATASSASGARAAYDHSTPADPNAVVTLEPGGSTVLIIEAGHDMRCASADQLNIELPSGGQPVSLSYPLHLCSIKVHPFG